MTAITVFSMVFVSVFKKSPRRTLLFSSVVGGLDPPDVNTRVTVPLPVVCPTRSVITVRRDSTCTVSALFVAVFRGLFGFLSTRHFLPTLVWSASPDATSWR